jgi:hypothetical protein
MPSTTQQARFQPGLLEQALDVGVKMAVQISLLFSVIANGKG